jgi:hypothetical protein
MLSYFQLGDQALLQSFLVGQPELRTMMQSPSMQQLRQRVIASYHLGPLDPTETQAYIEHRLRHVGWKDDPRFAPDSFALIHSLTGGIPRRINTLCNRLMLAGFLGEKHELDTSDVRTIADEMRAEIGSDLRVTVSGVDHGSTAAEYAQVTPAHELSLRRLEDRMDRVERTLGATIDLLSSVLHPEKNKAGSAGDR